MRKYILLVLLLTCACLSTDPNTNSVLSISDCRLPCWNDIKPGFTTVEDAKAILENTKGIGKENVKTLYESVEIHFSVSLDSPGVDQETRGDVFSDGRTVRELWLVNNLGISLGDLSDEIGEPDYVISLPFTGGGNTIIIIYANSGVSIQLSYETETIDSKSEIITLMLFDPADYYRLVSEGKFSQGGYNAEETQEIMYPWKGYGGIEESYPPRIP